MKKNYKIKGKDAKLIKMRKKSSLSKGELIVANFLKDNGIVFHSEWFFRELMHNKKTKYLFFDFYLPDHKVCIEFDGKQHYTREFNGKKIENGERNDFLKTAFCKKNGFDLLRIPYTDYEIIEQRICEFFDRKF